LQTGAAWRRPWSWAQPGSISGPGSWPPWKPPFPWGGSTGLSKPRRRTRSKWRSGTILVQSPGVGGYGTVIRALRTPFIDTWQHRRDEARREADRLRGEVLAALQQGRIHELLPFAGESAGLVHDIVPAGEIVQRLVAEARHTLERSQTLLT
jgi:hypothetical protein